MILNGKITKDIILSLVGPDSQMHWSEHIYGCLARVLDLPQLELEMAIGYYNQNFKQFLMLWFHHDILKPKV